MLHAQRGVMMAYEGKAMGERAALLVEACSMDSSIRLGSS